MYLAQGPRLIVTSSQDGLHFEYEEIVREDGSVSSTVPINSNLWRQYYCTDGAIKSSVTDDGLHWTKEEGARLKPEGNFMICDPAPIRSSSGWMLFYKAAELPRRHLQN